MKGATKKRGKKGKTADKKSREFGRGIAKGHGKGQRERSYKRVPEGGNRRKERLTAGGKKKSVEALFTGQGRQDLLARRRTQRIRGIVLESPGTCEQNKPRESSLEGLYGGMTDSDQ